MLVGVNERGRRVGQGHPRSKYSDDTVAVIKRLLAEGVKRSAVAMLLGIPYSTIRAIANGRRRNQEPWDFKEV